MNNNLQEICEQGDHFIAPGYFLHLRSALFKLQSDKGYRNLSEGSESLRHIEPAPHAQSAWEPTQVTLEFRITVNG